LKPPPGAFPSLDVAQTYDFDFFLPFLRGADLRLLTFRVSGGAQIMASSFMPSGSVK
jgi:hypothetical protein